MSGRFHRWCAIARQHPLPASPLTVAGFINDHAGLDPETLWAEIVNIDVAHEALGYAPPGRSTVALKAFSNTHPIEPPGSWSKDEKPLFLTLPWGIQAIIRRRETDRDREVRRCQAHADLWRKSKEKSHEADKASAA
jgi:hypothetical protein